MLVELYKIWEFYTGIKSTIPESRVLYQNQEYLCDRENDINLCIELII